MGCLFSRAQVTLDDLDEAVFAKDRVDGVAVTTPALNDQLEEFIDGSLSCRIDDLAVCLASLCAIARGVEDVVTDDAVDSCAKLGDCLDLRACSGFDVELTVAVLCIALAVCIILAGVGRVCKV